MGIWWHFCFRYHLDLYTMQEPSYLSKMALVWIWIRMVLTLIISQVYKRFSHLDIPTKHQILTGVTILISTGRVRWNHYWCWFLIPCIDLYTTPTLVMPLLVHLWRVKCACCRKYVQSSSGYVVYKQLKTCFRNHWLHHVSRTFPKYLVVFCLAFKTLVLSFTFDAFSMLVDTKRWSTVWLHTHFRVAILTLFRDPIIDSSVYKNL